MFRGGADAREEKAEKKDDRVALETKPTPQNDFRRIMELSGDCLSKYRGEVYKPGRGLVE